MARATALEADLPGQLRSSDDFRRYSVWWTTRERGWAHHKDCLMEIFGPVDDDAEGQSAAVRGDLGELGRRLKQFIDFCELEITPLLARIEGGVALLESAPRHPERDRYLTAIRAMRQKVRVALPRAWALASPAAYLYGLLRPEDRSQAERLWGPLTGTDPGDFSPLWKAHFPTARMNQLDDRLKALEATQCHSPAPTPPGAAAPSATAS
jgi:hypothetical protein